MNRTILSLLGAAMLYACGSTSQQTTTLESMLNSKRIWYKKLSCSI